MKAPLDLFRTSSIDWMTDALCTQIGLDPDQWFTYSHVVARRVCRACEVRTQCALYAQHETDMGDRLFGVWGGFTEGERRQIARRHRSEARAAAHAAAATLRKDA